VKDIYITRRERKSCERMRTTWESSISRKPYPSSVNFFVSARCNMRCRMCFAHFPQCGQLSKRDTGRLLDTLAQRFDKITFVGGEPTLYRSLPELVGQAKKAGSTTMMVTNGSRLTEKYLAQFGVALDWVGISVDSAEESTNRELGRAVYGKALGFSEYARAADIVRQYGIGLKVNHVVTRKNLNEDLTELFTAMKPDRLKIFRVMPVQGENAEDSRPLLISDHDFHCYVHRMRRTLSEALPDCNIVAENNDEMRGSYAMVSPDGRFFDQVHGFHRFSQPILEVGIDEAWSKVEFSQKIFKKRGGIYKWQRETTKQR
jgi:radical S-adenosyl methionine domain-containing protein 2